MYFTISRPPKKRKAQPGAEAASAATCAIGFYVGLGAQNAFGKLGFGVGPDVTIAVNFNLTQQICDPAAVKNYQRTTEVNGCRYGELASYHDSML